MAGTLPPEPRSPLSPPLLTKERGPGGIGANLGVPRRSNQSSLRDERSVRTLGSVGSNPRLPSSGRVATATPVLPQVPLDAKLAHMGAGGAVPLGLNEWARGEAAVE